MSEEIRNKLWNIQLVVNDIKKFPQTYKTILGVLCSEGTCQTILRRKLSKLCKRGEVYRSVIPGTRFGLAIFYCYPKKYNIIVLADRIKGSRVFCFFKFKKLSKYYIEVGECWELKKNYWDKHKGKKKFFQGNVLKWI